jgi:hypothetical protein
LAISLLALDHELMRLPYISEALRIPTTGPDTRNSHQLGIPIHFQKAEFAPCSSDEAANSYLDEFKVHLSTALAPPSVPITVQVLCGDEIPLIFNMKPFRE